MTIVPGLSDTTLYWIIGFVAFFLLMGSWLFIALATWGLSKKPGAVIYEDLSTGEKYYVDPESLRPAPVAGNSIITQKRGPLGLFSRDMTIPDPYIERDKSGKRKRFISPKALHYQHVTGEIAAEIGQVTELSMLYEETRIQLREEQLKNQGQADKLLDDSAKRQKEMVPYMNLNKPQQRGNTYAYHQTPK